MRGKKAKRLRRLADDTNCDPLVLPRWFLGGGKQGKFTARYPAGHWRRIYRDLKKGRIS